MFLVVTKYLIPRGYNGLAFFPFVFIKEKQDKENAQIINHERIHLRQQLELLIIPFLVWYFLEFLWLWIRYKNKEVAYRNISFEREAYANEKNSNYLNKRQFWAFIKWLY